jgi:cell division protein FtsW (lipid II flippase)
MNTSLRNFHWLATLSVILGLVFLYEVIPPVPVRIGSPALFALGSRAIAFAVMEAVLGLIAVIFLKAQRKRTAWIAFGFAALLCLSAAIHYIHASRVNGN